MPPITLPGWASPAHFAAALLVTVSTVANLSFGWSLGSSPVEKFVLLGAGLAAEFGTATGLIHVSKFLRKADIQRAAAAGVVFVLAASFSLVAALGFASHGRESMAENRQARLELAQQIKALGTPRPAGAIEAEMGAILADKRAEGCAVMNGPYTRTHCPRYLLLKSELETRRQLDALLAKQQMQGGDGSSVLSVDPTAAYVSTYLAKLGYEVDETEVRRFLALGVVLFIWLGAMLGFYVAEGIREQKEAAARKPAADTRSQDPPAPPAKPVLASVPGVSLPAAKPRKVSGGRSIGAKVLHKVKARGGEVAATSQAALAKQLGVSRTSLRRVAESMAELRLLRDGESTRLVLV